MNKFLIDRPTEGSGLDLEAGRLLRERDHRRLREMTFYCTASGCLRAFILRYFGEDPPRFCDNCGNCKTGFENVDVTVDAKKILSCVARMKRSYGAGLVTDVLRGVGSKRIKELGFDRLSTYGICDESAYRLCSVIDFLVRRGYLERSDDDYPVLRLSPSSNDVLFGSVKLEMMLPKPKQQGKSAETPAPGVAGFGKSAQDGAKIDRSARPKPLPPDRQQLFDRLKAVRRELADSQGVPAFVVFSDNTLVEMCRIMPASPQEFLTVPGVGAEKLRHYGEVFIAEIKKYRNDAF